MVESTATGQRKTKRKAMQDTRTGTNTVPRRTMEAQRQALIRVCCMKGFSTDGGNRDLIVCRLRADSNVALASNTAGSESNGGDVELNTLGSESEGGDLELNTAGSESKGGDAELNTLGSESKDGDMELNTAGSESKRGDEARITAGSESNSWDLELNTLGSESKDGDVELNTAGSESNFSGSKSEVGCAMRLTFP